MNQDPKKVSQHKKVDLRMPLVHSCLINNEPIYTLLSTLMSLNPYKGQARGSIQQEEATARPRYLPP